MSNHLWQSTLFAVAAALLTLAFRSNRAQVRYSIWFAATCKFLLPFSLLIAIGSRTHWAAPPRAIPTPGVATGALQMAEPFAAEWSYLPVASQPVDWLPAVLAAAWAAGFAAVVLLRYRGWRGIRAALHASMPAGISAGAGVEVRIVPGLLEPGVVGIFHPVLLLPAGVAGRLTPAQLDAVLAHEVCHIRRRDNCTAALHMLVQAVFWFHPLVWWIGARLVEERERACDEAVLSRGGQPRDYAEAILSVCKLYLESPLACVAGVTGADLKKRIHGILSGRVAGDLSAAKQAALAAAGLLALAAPVAIGTLRVSVARAQSSAPRFEVVSIKPCHDDTRSVGGRGESSPGRLSTGCTTVAALVRGAYELYARGHLARDPSYPRIEGGPSWIQSERYAIDACAPGAPSEGTMLGPMMQTLLADRFQLKLHSETREVPVYDLTVAKAGARLAPFHEGSCTPVDFGDGLPGMGTRNHCIQVIGDRGPTSDMTAQGVTVDQFRKLLFLILDRPMIDRTGISGRYDFHLEFARTAETPMLTPDGNPAFAAQPEEGAGRSIFSVLERQFGLKLVPAKGPREYLVIDSVARPPAN